MTDKDRIDQKNFRKNRKNAYIQILGGHCNICGYNKCSAALEFHHINPKEKNFFMYPAPGRLFCVLRRFNLTKGNL